MATVHIVERIPAIGQAEGRRWKHGPDSRGRQPMPEGG